MRAEQSEGLSLPETEGVESLTGRGLCASFDGQTVLIGSLTLMDETGVDITDAQRQGLEELQASGKTIMLIATGSKLSGALALADTLRPDAAATMAALKEIGVRDTIMLTGDNPRVAAANARQANLSDFRAGLMPEDKVAEIRNLVQAHGEVAMVSDGVNDAPALANATLGIAMGGAGTDVALETADVALMVNDLSKLPFAVGLGRASRTIIIQNLVIALGVIAVLIVASLTGLVGIGIAIVFHEGSTLVVLNALRLLEYRV